MVDDDWKYHLKVQPVLRAGEVPINFQRAEANSGALHPYFV
jgi:hypothetical protein